MKFGTLYSYWGTQWNCNYEEVLKKVAEIGFDVLEIGADHIYRMTDKELAELSTAAKGYGLTLSTNSGPGKEYDLASADPNIRKNGLDYFNRILHCMEKIDSPVLAGAIYSFWPCDFQVVDKETAWERSIAGLKELGKTAENLGKEISLEVLNRNETFILTDCKEGLEYCEQIGGKQVNLLLDTYHMNIEEDSITGAIRLAGNKLGHFHVGENNRKLPGMNNSLDWAGIGQALRDINYEKAVVIEPFLLSGGAVGQDIRVWREMAEKTDTASMDKYLADALAFLKKNFE